jgi:hypothetical protein
MSPFGSFYNNALYRNLICSLGIIYNPCPEGCAEGGGRFNLIDKFPELKTTFYVE